MGRHGVSEITAKVKVFKSPSHNEDVRLDFQGDYSDGRNQEWSSATPLINLTMYVKPEVAEKFEHGSAYTLTFTKGD
jgi:hypothetical protein